MPTAINVKEEKKAKTNIVRFETSTSPNWKDIKMFIRKDFFSLGFFPVFVGLITTFLSSLFAIDFLLKFFTSNGLKIFIIYRVIFGFVILLNL